MSKHYPPEFRADVVAMALKGEVTKRQFAEDVGISETTLHRWIRQFEVDQGEREGTSSDEREELRQLRRDKRRLQQENEILRHAVVLRQGRTPNITYPLVNDLADDGIAVVVTCRVLGFSPQGYYRWLADPVSQRDWDAAHLVNAIVDIHADDPASGYRFIADEVELAGWQVGENRIARLCREHRIWDASRPAHGRGTVPCQRTTLHVETTLGHG